MKIPSFLQKDVNIAFLSAFKTEGIAAYYFDVTTLDDVLLLPELAFFARQANIPFLVIGWGTNCLFAFDVFPGILVRNRFTGHSEPVDQDGKKYIRVNSGEVATTFAMSLYQHHGISTLIPWVGLPGTMGGACIGNAGCFGLEMQDIFVEADVIDLETGERHVYTRENMHYAYRESILKGNEKYFVISILIDVSTVPPNEYMSYTPAELQAIRRLKQPPGFSCGSFFKNPKIEEYHEFIGGKENLTGERGQILTLSAGKLIDDAGLKGTRIGGVKVSERHGNFFINDEKWTWRDVLALRDLVKSQVKEKFGIELHEEVRIITA